MDFQQKKEMWAAFIYDGQTDSRLDPILAESWLRCRRNKVNPAGGRGKCAEGEVFRSICEANGDLIRTALPVMEQIFNEVDASHYMVVLTDCAGYILETMGDAFISSKSDDITFRKGALWNSVEVGTNAISVALEFGRPMQMAGADHYCQSHHDWTCSAAPIHGSNGEVIGCLNLSGKAETVHPHTLALAIAGAESIETQLVQQQHALLLHAALDASSDAVFLLDSRYHPFWENCAAKKLSSDALSDSNSLDFRKALPDLDWSSDLTDFHSDDTRLFLSDPPLHCGVNLRRMNLNGQTVYAVTVRKQKHLLNIVNQYSRNKAIYTFDKLSSHDPDMSATISLARRFSRYEGNILIEGEAGTRKECLAQAIHNASRNSSGPFVTVHCESLSHETLEAELFGTEAGSGGGTDQVSSPGRFELAQHGTLFLNEVSEIPLEFQGRLLDAVENHSIRRLGSSQNLDLDIRIIAASSRNLEQLVQSGTFRSDLYHRLNILKLDIPPLRMRRNDIPLYACTALFRLNESFPELHKDVTEEFLNGLERYEWPGNIRQLINGVERAFFSESRPCLDGKSLSYVFEQSSSSAACTAAEDSPERRAICEALENCAGDVEQTAVLLGLSRATLYRKLRRYGINPKAVRQQLQTRI